ncbi:MAG TPA: tRNA (N6-threonylcarbamoyladenosine(37)-N6)-methyltransferase TrmO [Candidatus Methanofastidiosa archaeon]|nr:tRNA (N6-threonylcarbamoyladenosine(37)-N6)-methyltransferase TrmO [Candidatus Methanofastidiosa archaeon]HPR42438.1 tRNA (N6-threonylcarbamoyladenosine(37)-N6)-methyltransferase TrmO [Candidatus Methanofastidiosa archaeon]
MPNEIAMLYEVGKVLEVDGKVSTIEIHQEFSDALYKIDTQEYLLILFWIPLSRDVLKVHPCGDTNNPVRGVFSTRSPMRPNNIGVTEVRLLERTGNIIKVEGLDAFEGTSVIDIKNSKGTRYGDKHH